MCLDERINLLESSDTMRRSCNNARLDTQPFQGYSSSSSLLVYLGRINPLRHVLLCPNRHVINFDCSPSNACTIHLLVSSLLDVAMDPCSLCGLCTREAVSLTLDPISGMHHALAYHALACLDLLTDHAWVTYCG